eukprot:scaffold61153_cov52-Phaeocystis_antarctica.AAC.1
MQGGNRCLGRAIERQRARWHDPVLKYRCRWLGLTPEQPALCLRGFPGWPPGQPRVGSVTLPGWVGVREPRGRLGGLYAKNVTICPTHACSVHHTPRTRGRVTGDPQSSLYIEFSFSNRIYPH